MIDPLAMAQVDLGPEDFAERLEHLNYFNPLVLTQSAVEPQAPQRTEGDHLFDPMSFENSVMDRALNVRSTHKSAADKIAQKMEEAFLQTEAGRAYRLANRRRRRWIGWSGLGLQVLALSLASPIHAARGIEAWTMRELFLMISVIELVGGTALAFFAPRSLPDSSGKVRSRVVELALGWVAVAIIADFALVMVVPLLSGKVPDLKFYAYSWPWPWVSYAVLASSAWLGRGLHLLLYRQPANTTPAESRHPSE